MPSTSSFVSVLAPLCLFVTLLHGQATTQTTTIHVPADAPTIQAGIDAAQNGSIVLVAPGTYTENLDFKGKSITVTSGATTYAAAAGTILQGTGTGPIVSFKTNETRASVLNGFTIENGTTSAVYFQSASGTLSNNALTNNLGCGVEVLGQTASPRIVGNDIAYTGATDSDTTVCGAIPSGTAIGVIQAGSVELTGNTIENNGTYTPNPGNPQLQYSAGTGIFAASNTTATTLLIQNNTIRNNVSANFGVAIDLSGIAQVSIIQNLIYGNKSTAPGAGISSLVMDANIPNVAAFSQTVVNNSIYGNVNVLAGQQHMGQYGNQADFAIQTPIKMAPYDIRNNLFVATDQYGTVNCAEDSASPVTYQNNDAFYSGASQPLLCTASGSVQAVDPQFMNTTTFDFHVQRTSPVANAGDINAPSLPAADFAGKNRTVCGSVDLGVYQNHPQPVLSLVSAASNTVVGANTTFSAHLTGNCNIPSGLITFVDGTTQLGTATLNSSGDTSFTTTALAAGTHTITATYPGDFNFDASSPAAVQQTVIGPPAMVLTGSPNPAALGKLVTLVATLSGINGAATSGTVTFADQFATLGTAPVSAGVAVFTTSTLTGGTHTITASFSGSTNYAPGTSSPLNETIQTFDFTLSLTPATLTLQTGKSGQTTVQITGLGNLPGNISLTASQIPQYGAAAFSLTSVEFAATGTANSVLTIDTEPYPAQVSALNQPTPGNKLPTVPLVAGLVLCPLLFAARRNRSLRLLCALLTCAFLSTLTGCAGLDEYGANRVAPGTYSIPVTATDQTTGITHTTTLTLIVTR